MDWNNLSQQLRWDWSCCESIHHSESKNGIMKYMWKSTHVRLGRLCMLGAQFDTRLTKVRYSKPAQSVSTVCWTQWIVHFFIHTLDHFKKTQFSCLAFSFHKGFGLLIKVDDGLMAHSVGHFYPFYFNPPIFLLSIFTQVFIPAS
jgi:hypothetical protein